MANTNPCFLVGVKGLFAAIFGVMDYAANEKMDPPTRAFKALETALDFAEKSRLWGDVIECFGPPEKNSCLCKTNSYLVYSSE